MFIYLGRVVFFVNKDDSVYFIKFCEDFIFIYALWYDVCESSDIVFFIVGELYFFVVFSGVRGRGIFKI